VDNFSFKRGRSWGTILVDLERHRLVDILPDRSSVTFAHWLTQHAGVEVVSRDRGGEYADAVRKAAPEAIQGKRTASTSSRTSGTWCCACSSGVRRAFTVRTRSRSSPPAAYPPQAGPGGLPRAHQGPDAKPV
jgi:hypothetical protein